MELVTLNKDETVSVHITVLILLIIYSSAPMSSEDYYEQVDPVEKEWAHALIDGRLDTIHQLILSDVSYINKKGFLNVSVLLCYIIMLY